MHFVRKTGANGQIGFRSGRSAASGPGFLLSRAENGASECDSHHINENVLEKIIARDTGMEVVFKCGVTIEKNNGNRLTNYIARDIIGANKSHTI